MLSVEGKNNQGAVQLPVQMLRFPGGEWHVRLETPELAATCDAFEIHALLQNADQVMQLLMLTDALRRVAPAARLHLNMPYVPYARQDRVANPGESLSIRVFCDLINAQHYDLVRIQDPHSDVTPALLNRVVVDSPLPALQKIIAETGPVTLVAPDAGARKRVAALAKTLDCLFVCAEKSRDTLSGHLSGARIPDQLPDQPLLIVDDICDGGGTFLALASAIRQAQAAQTIRQPLYLYVTHGIFSKGADQLLEEYQRIFTRHRWTDDTRCEVV
mgnify:CR=1 FL=1